MLTYDGTAISDEDMSDVEVTNQTSGRSGRAKAGVKYTEPGPLELDDEEEAQNGKDATIAEVKDEDEEEDGEDGDEPEE
jgi:hypothetical protein